MRRIGKGRRAATVGSQAPSALPTPKGRWLLPTFVLIACAFLFNSYNLPLTAGLILRTVAWFLLAIALLRCSFMRRFNLVQLNVVWVLIGFGLWPPGLLLAKFLIGSSPVVSDLWDACRRSPSYLVANDLMYMFTAISSAIYYLGTSFGSSKRAYFDVDSEQFERDRGQWLSLGVVLLGIGYIAAVIKTHLPSGFDQLAAWLSAARMGGIFAFAVVAFSSGKRTRVMDCTILIITIGMVGVTGFFEGQGQKGALIVTVVALWLLYLGVAKSGRVLASGATFLLLLALAPLLPYLNTYKATAIESQTVGVVQGVRTARQIDQAMIAAQLGDLVALPDYWSYYFFNRVTTVNLGARYVEAYQDQRVGYSFLRPVLFSFVPRIFYRDKIDSNQYYNEFARVSGVGSFDDAVTSRKPNLIDEFYSIAGIGGVILAAFIYAVAMIIMQKVLNGKVFHHGVGLLIAFIVFPSLGANYLANLITGSVFYFGGYVVLGLVFFSPWFRRVDV